MDSRDRIHKNGKLKQNLKYIYLLVKSFIKLFLSTKGIFYLTSYPQGQGVLLKYLVNDEYKQMNGQTDA